MRIPTQKPFYELSNELLPLDHFNIQKNYIFNVLRLCVAESFKKHEARSSKVSFLDAASQNLLARHIFPVNEKFIYYGVDYDPQRFINWKGRARSESDRVFLADLTKAVTDPPGFHIVVSSNTLSHIPPELWPTVFRQLVDFVLIDGDLFVNFPLTSGWEEIISNTEKLFADCEIVFYTTTASLRYGELFAGSPIPDILRLSWECEASVVNQTSGHGQALVCFRGKTSDNVAKRLHLDLFQDPDQIVSLTDITLPTKLSISDIKTICEDFLRENSGQSYGLVAPRNLLDSVVAIISEGKVADVTLQEPEWVAAYEDVDSFDVGMLATTGMIVFLGTEYRNLSTTSAQRDARLFINRIKSSRDFSGRLVLLTANNWFGVDTSRLTDLARFS